MRILVSAESFGYGPIATCLSVVKELKKQNDVVLDFIGSGVSLEQARLSGYFNKFYNCDTFDFKSLEKYEDIFKLYDVFFSSENINGAIYALNYTKNVYYVDNLVWMWDEIPKLLGNVKKYFISETFPSKENFQRIGHVIKNPVFVGPVRNFCLEKKYDIKNQLLINIGGASSFLLDQTIINKFYNKILNILLSSPKISQFDSIIICGGSAVIDNLVIENNNQKIILKTLANEEYLKVMSESSHCILASGLGNFIETLNKNKPIMYLPAVNYSQLLQLQYYEKMDFGFSILNWDKFDFYKEIPKYLDEQSGVDMVVDNITKFNEGDYSKMININMEKFLTQSQESYFSKRNNFFELFDKKAANIIAETIYNENK